MRLFVCIPLPSGIGEILAEATAPGRHRWPRLHWVPAEQLHVTIWFIGAASPERLSKIRASLRRRLRGVPSFVARLAAWGGFPHSTAARVLWAGVEAAELSGLEARLRSTAEELGVPVEDRPFHPHVTLARSKGPLDLSEGGMSFAEGAWTVGEVILMESRTTGGTVHYHPVDRYALEAA